MESSQHKRKHKRSLKSLLIEPFRQIKLGLYVMGITLIFVLICAYFYRQAFEEQYSHVMEIFGVVEEATREEVIVNDIFLKNRLRLLTLFAAYVVIMFTVIFRMTHKYYGPLVSIERFVKSIESGQYHQRVTIRKGDELERLVGSLNQMAEALEKRHGKGTVN